MDLIKDRVMEYLKSLPAFYAMEGLATHLPLGQPDILGCYKGWFLALEVKNPGESPTEIQKAALKKLADSGAVAGVVRSVEDVELVIKVLPSVPSKVFPEWIDYTWMRTEGMVWDTINGVYFMSPGAKRRLEEARVNA